jgi:hypothetical protein
MRDLQAIIGRVEIEALHGEFTDAVMMRVSLREVLQRRNPWQSLPRRLLAAQSRAGGMLARQGIRHPAPAPGRSRTYLG